MSELELAEPAVRDLERIVDFAKANDDGAGRRRLLAILRSLEVLLSSPFIGRPTGRGTRELVIGRGAMGFVALYRLDEGAELVLVLGLRGQREVGFDEEEE